MPNYQLIILYSASFLDYIIGDPVNWFHPVQLMGFIISQYQNFVLNNISGKFIRKLAGIIITIVLVGGSGFCSWLVIYYAIKLNFYLGFFVQIILLASCFAGKSLRLASEDVLQYLTNNNLSENDLSQARYRLSFYVGRDTENLTVDDIFRAVLETVAENTTDGVTAPLFYSLIGVFIPSIGCVPFAIAYKAISTLDSMIGYKKEPFIDIGWFSAKLEDYLTFIPCRLTVITLALFSGRFWHNILECKQYAIQDPSPNSGWSEGIFAVILGVQLGGENTYRGEKKFKPLLGKPINKIGKKTIKKALLLTRYCFLSWILITTFISFLIK